MDKINLIPRSRIESRKTRTHLRFWVLGNACVALALGLAVSVWRLSSQVQDGVTVGHVVNARNDLAKLSASLALAESELRDASRADIASQVLRNTPDWGVLLAMVANETREDCVLRNITVEAQDRTATADGPARFFKLKLDGLARSHSAATEFVLRFQKLGLFSSIKLGRSKREPFLTATAMTIEMECAIED